MNKCKLGDVASVIISNVDKKSYENEIKVKLCNFTDVYYNWAITLRDEPKLMIATATNNEICKYKLHKGDVAITKDSETKEDIGQSTLIADEIPDMLLGYHCALIRPNTDKLLGAYLNAVLHTKLATRYFELNASGSGQRYTLSVDAINDFQLYLPSINEQERISKILTDIDRKIENNTCINDNLQQVIKSCFDFMFAARKPNGIISDILQEHPKSTIQVNDSTGILGDYPFFTSGEAINEWQSALVDGMNCYLSTGGNATIKGYYGKAAYSTDTWCVCGKGEYSFYLFCYLKSIIRSINDSFFAGSGLKHLQKDSLLLVNLYIPSEKELEKFNSIVKPAMETMTKLFLETKKLKQQRDFLLPLLMNGQATIAE